MSELHTPKLDELKDALPDAARDLRLNLGTVLNGEVLSAEQTWGVALAAAFYLREDRLRDALLADARASGVSDHLLDDARAAAALMAMNTVYYRCRHMLGKESYDQKPARLRMTWMARPKTSKADYELMSLAVAALAGCERCLVSHEHSVLNAGLGENHVHDVVRIAAVLHGIAVALHTG